MKFTLEQKAGMSRMYDWFDTLASVDHTNYYNIVHKNHINASFRDCAGWIFNRMGHDNYDMEQRDILNAFRLIYLKNKKVTNYDELILNTSKLI